MTRNAKSLDRDILAVTDAGWTEEPAVVLSEEELDRLIGLFGGLDDLNRDRLRAPIRRIFNSFVRVSIAERGTTGDGRVVRPSTAALRQLRELGQRVRSLDSALSDLQSGTRAVIDADLEARGLLRADSSKLRSRELLDRTYAVLDQWHGVIRLGEIPAGKGPNNVAARRMVEAMANWWEEVHGVRPKTDRGRGNRTDPFLDLCQELARVARPRLRQLGVDLGTMNLSGIVDDVLNNAGQGRS